MAENYSIKQKEESGAVIFSVSGYFGESAGDELVAKVEELQSCVGVYMSELETLRTYKAEKEESEKIFTIEETISKFSDILPADVIEEYRGRIKDIKYSEVTAFCNEIKARIVDFVDLKSDKNPNRMSVQIPPKPKKEKSEFLY